MQEKEPLQTMMDKRKDTNDSGNDRVTLKKEIGLLSACAIIIGENLTDLC